MSPQNFSYNVQQQFELYSEPTKPVALIAEKGAVGVGWCSAQKKVKWKLVGF